MKKILLFAMVCLATFACKKKTTTSATLGTDLSGTKIIIPYSAVVPDASDGLFEVVYDGTGYILATIIGLGQTSSWGGWKIIKQSNAFALVPADFPTKAIDAAMLGGAYHLSNYPGGTTQQFYFEASDVANVYYIKTVDGKYMSINFSSTGDASYQLASTKPTETTMNICRFTIK
jgi:hypothetical protein